MAEVFPHPLTVEIARFCRDGLNRYPIEFTLARHRHGEFPDARCGVGLPNQGLVIISEFISSARVMRGGLNVNPWRVQEVRF
jgi:trehalose-6-phosphate synthase